MALLFPGTEKQFEEKTSFDKFDQVLDTAAKETYGYFVLSEKEDIYLFMVSGRLYAAGRIEKDGPVFLDIREFFDAFKKVGTANLSFYKAERKLIQCILVYFSKEPAKKFTPDMVDLEKVLSGLESGGTNCIIAIKEDGKVGFSVCLNGRISFNYIPYEPNLDEQPRDALMVHIYNNGSASVEIFDNMQLSPASDALHPSSDLPASLSAHYSKPATTSSVSGAEVLVTLDNKVIAKHTITKSETSIGRTDASDIVIDDPGVSRNHAVIREEDGSFVIEDKGSTNGTFVNGEKITAKEIKDGDKITILKHVLQFKYSAAAPAETENEAEKTMIISPAAAAAPKVKKEGRLLLEDGRSFPLKSAVFTIGSSKNVDLCLEGLLIAGHQASITMGREGRAVLNHKGSFFSATKVNGQNIEQQVLQNNDIIEIGKYKIKYIKS